MLFFPDLDSDLDQNPDQYLNPDPDIDLPTNILGIMCYFLHIQIQTKNRIQT